MTLSETDTNNLNELSRKIEVNFKDLSILKEALTHRSFLNEVRTEELKHNERLEFLGDAVLELLVTHFLFEKYPTRPEGELTSFRAALVRTESLADEAERLNLGEYLFMSKGEAATGGRKRPYILANSFEALIGAIYLDQGLEECNKFISRVLLGKTDKIVQNRLDLDAKSKLQEISQETLKVTPTYTLKEESGPDHDKTFVMTVTVGSENFGEGSGKSKQEAEQSAASSALQNWQELYQNYINSVKITRS